MRRRHPDAERGSGRASQLSEPLGPGAHCYAVRMNGLRGACAVGLSRGEKQAWRPGCGHMMGGGEGAMNGERRWGWTWREPGGAALCDPERRLGRRLQSPPFNLCCCRRQIKTKQKKNPGEVDSRVFVDLNAACCLGDCSAVRSHLS